MPHYICRWSSGDVLFASVSSRDELEAILEEKGEAGSCKVARYSGPVAFELAPKLPGVARSSSKRFKVGSGRGCRAPAARACLQPGQPPAAASRPRPARTR
jgi:hypothetical protein